MEWPFLVVAFTLGFLARPMIERLIARFLDVLIKWGL